MKIAYDAKRYFHNQSGLGNYSRDVVRIIEENSSHEALLLDSSSAEKGMGKSGIYKLFPSFFWRSFGIWKNVKRLKANAFHGLSNELPFGKAPKGVKVVVTIHDVIFKHYPAHYKPLDRYIYNLKTKSACKKADVIIAISPQTKADLISFYHVPEEKIQVIYQPTAKDFMLEPVKEDLVFCQQKYNLPKDFYLYVSSFEERKNQAYLVKVFQEMKEGFLILAGFQGKAYEDVKTLVTKYNLEDRVFLITDASKRDLKSLYHLCKAFLYPSLLEGFGIPVLEALHSGKTVYCNGQENFTAMFGEACHYFDVQDPSSLKSLLEKGEEIPVAARKKVLEQFDEKKLAGEIVGAYQLDSNSL
jgi:glycosyltransferase involved in cell wall biosynthesis